MAETTTITLLPASWTAARRAATALMRSADATELPPYFCTTSRHALVFSLSRQYSLIPAESGPRKLHIHHTCMRASLAYK